MTRTEPDRKFASAARTELLQHVRDHRGVDVGSSTLARRVGQVLAAGFVVAVSVAVLVGAQHARHAIDAPMAPQVGASVAPVPSPALRTTPTPTTALIGPPAARRRTDAEIRSWAAGIGATAVTTRQAVLTTHCMAQKGFLYDPIELRTADLRAGHSGMSPVNERAWNVALYGPASTGPYDWRTAGCDGLAVHQTGMDGKH